MSTGERWRLGHRPALDGLRGIAVLLVIASHIGHLLGGAGGVGVTVFFALSGFLITTLLLEELDDTGRISLKGFYQRRARRLLPALAAFLAVLGLLSVAFWFPLLAPGHALAIVTYSTNWVMIAQEEGLPRVNHLWSLAVEEQFYILWPLVLIAAARLGRRALIWICVLGSIGAAVERVWLWEIDATASRIYYATDARADSLLAGCLLAVIMHARPEGRSRPVLAGVLLVSLLPLCATQGTLRWMIIPAMVPWVSAAVLFCIAQGRGPRWLSTRCLVLCGRRSYALYLWHPLFITTLAPATALPEWLSIPIAVAGTWGTAALSWRYIEAPLLRKRSAEPEPLHGDGRGPGGGVSVDAEAELVRPRGSHVT